MNRLTQIKYLKTLFDFHKWKFNENDIRNLCYYVYPSRKEAYDAIDNFCKKHNVPTECFYCQDVSSFTNINEYDY